MVRMGVRKEVKGGNGCGAWQRAKLINSDWKWRDEAMEGGPSGHRELPLLMRFSVVDGFRNLLQLLWRTHQLVGPGIPDDMPGSTNVGLVIIKSFCTRW
jgi:hypothetical protein